MKKSIEYYQHYSNSDRHPKFMYLRMKFGWEGEGKFWALNNAIAESHGCKLDLNENYVKISLAHRLDFTLDQLDVFIDFLVTECKLLILEEGFISTNITQKNYKVVMKERKKARDRKEKNSPAKKICKKKFGRTFEESKVNEIKEKEIKGEGIKEKAPEVFLSPTPFEEILFLFLNEYKELRGIDYIVYDKNKELAAANEILKLKGKDKLDDDLREELTKLFKRCVTLDDKWHYSQMSLSHIASNLNELMNKTDKGDKKFFKITELREMYKEHYYPGANSKNDPIKNLYKKVDAGYSYPVYTRA